MKKSRILIVTLAVCLLAALCGLAACQPTQTPGPGPGPDPHPETPVYGLPTPAVGQYIKDADVVDDGATRYLVYVTNEESGEEDNVIAVRSGQYVQEKGWAYGDEHIVVRGGTGAWDANIGSASIVKGRFAYNGTDYNWMIAYCATKQTNDTQNQIGLALATEPTGTWQKVGTAPIVTFDADLYGSSAVGCYAPALVNLDKQSKIRLYYTYADQYGHFAQFVDLNAADVDALTGEGAATDVDLISGSVQLPNNGNIAGGDSVAMFPNADFAHDAAGKVYAVKDYSPSAATKPNYAERIELLSIDEAEFYTVETLDGWASIKLWDMTDTEDGAYERLYSATIVSDAYGYVSGDGEAEIVYNVCDIEVDNADWLFSQKLQTFTVSLQAE